LILVDTNVLSEALRPAPEPAVMHWLNVNAATYRVPAVVFAEMWAGVEVMPVGARRLRLTAAIEQIEHRFVALDRVLPITLEIARAFGTVIGQRQRKGKGTKPMDALIAATALVHNAALATRNTSDFTNVGLTLINPWEAR
jgi:toxin FitB